EPPIVLLLDLASERMVVALGAIDPRAVDHRRDGLGHLLMIVSPLVEKPNRAGVFGPRGPGGDYGADKIVPRPILLVGVLPKGMPSSFTARIILAAPPPAH